MIAVLHTWGRNLSQHVHLHCLVPGGILSEDGQWHAAKSNYLFPVKALPRRFQGCMVSELRQADQAGQLHRLNAESVDLMLDTLMRQEWVVYSKPSLQRTDSVIGYLARYSHRIAISAQRLERLDDNGVTFRYRDTRQQCDNRADPERG